MEIHTNGAPQTNATLQVNTVQDLETGLELPRLGFRQTFHLKMQDVVFSR